jgi:PrcB C-terminal
MTRRRALSLALLLSLPVAACNGSSPTVPTLPNGPITLGPPLYAAQNSGITESTRQVVRVQSTFEMVWADVVGAQMPVPPLPDVDFQRDMVLVVGLGTQPDGCYAIAVTDAFGDGIDLTVTVTETGPTPTCTCALGLVQPVEVIEVPRADQVHFRTATATDCPS